MHTFIDVVELGQVVEAGGDVGTRVGAGDEIGAPAQEQPCGASRPLFVYWDISLGYIVVFRCAPAVLRGLERFSHYRKA